MFHIILLLVLLVVWVVFAPSKVRSGGSESETSPNFAPYYNRCIDGLDREAYVKRSAWTKITLHLGQRKLLCNEVEFLTNYGGEEEIVVYAGAAPGHHTVLLAQMFPNYQFCLYDPRAFNDKLHDLPNVQPHNEYFTDEIAASYQGKNVLFVCDIRTGTIATADKDVVVNMEQQRVWTELMKPKYAMLKFRLPWKPGKTKYFTGDIFLQPWVGAASTETRLITDGKKYTTYDNTEYDEKIFHYQRSRRPAYHDHDISAPGVDHCHDCWSEIQIVRNYLGKSEELLGTDIPPTKENIIRYIQLFTKYTGWDPDSPPHGCYPDEHNIWKKMKSLKNITEKAFIDNIERKNAYAESAEVTLLRDDVA